MRPEDAETFSRTMVLGRELARTLDDSDVLGRWMAHHVADILTRLETVAPEEAEGLRAETADVILRLWEHRAGSPRRSVPLETFERVIAALDRLTGTQPPWGYYKVFDRHSEPSEADLALTPLLTTAIAIEHAARDAVLATVSEAARRATDREAQWLEVSTHLADDTFIHLARGLYRQLHPEAENEPAEEAAGTSGRLMSIAARIKGLAELIEQAAQEAD